MPINFPNLPGVNVEIQDGGLTLSRTAIGPKVVLLGCSTASGVQATPFTPYLVGRPDEAAIHFNNHDGSVSELTKGMYECFVGGARNVALMNIWPSGHHAGPTSDERYNALETAYDNLLSYDADVVVPVNAEMDVADLTGGRNFGYQLADFCYRSTRETNTTIGVIGVKTAIASPSGMPTLPEVNAWVSGLCNFNNNLIFDGVTDANGDGKPDNYALWATTNGEVPVGNPPQDNAHVIKDGLNHPVDIGAFLSVVAVDARLSNEASISLYPDTRFYNASGVTAYAGLVASLSSKSAPTNKMLPGATSQRSLSLSQANSLVGNRYVTCIDKPRGFVVASAVTGAYNISKYHRSDFVRLTTVRVVHDVANVVRDAADPFIGEPNSAPQRNALESAIDAGLRLMQEDGALQRFRFTIFSTPSDQVLGKALVELSLVPAFELTEITTIISLASS